MTFDITTAMAFISTLNDIKIGLVVNYLNEPYIVLEAKFVRMQQRKPVMQTKMRNVITNKVVEYSFKPGEKVEEAEISRKKVNFLYKAGDEFVFMDNIDYEQVSLKAGMIGEKGNFLKEGCEVQFVMFDNRPINLELPPKMEFKVTNTMDAVKGDTSGRVLKQAIIETGYAVGVPLFVKEGDTIRINTDSGEYVERV